MYAGYPRAILDNEDKWHDLPARTLDDEIGMNPSFAANAWAMLAAEPSFDDFLDSCNVEP